MPAHARGQMDDVGQAARGVTRLIVPYAIDLAQSRSVLNAYSLRDYRDKMLADYFRLN